MGDPDLSRGGSPPASPAPSSLRDLIRAGDADAIAGFRDAHIGMVRGYCVVACAPQLVAEACEAAFLDFVGRLKAADPAEQSLEAVLLAATRSAAAGRFDPPPTEQDPGPHRHPASSPLPRICAGMPELLAARANGELRGDDQAIVDHIAGCAHCSASDARLHTAEGVFSTASGWLAGNVSEPT